MTTPKSVDETPQADQAKNLKAATWFAYLLVDGSLRNKQRKGLFETTDYPTQEDVEMGLMEGNLYPPGKYRLEKKVGGITKDSFTCTKPDPSFFRQQEPERERVIDLEPEEFEDEQEPEAYSLNENAGNLTAVEVENLFLKERLRRLEEDTQRQKSGNQGETQALISALEESRREQRELLLMMLQQAQKPQADAGTLAMSMMQQSLEMVKSAKAMSEEIAPSGSGEGSGGFLADGAKIIDSLGRAAPTFLPILAGLMPKTPPAPFAPSRAEVPFVPVANENTGGGELAELAEKIQKKETAKK